MEKIHNRSFGEVTLEQLNTRMEWVHSISQMEQNEFDRMMELLIKNDF